LLCGLMDKVEPRETVRKGAEWCLDRTFGWHTTAKSGLFRLVFGLVGLWLGALRDFSDSLSRHFGG
jgi:hypothetical protein